MLDSFGNMLGQRLMMVKFLHECKQCAFVQCTGLIG